MYNSFWIILSSFKSKISLNYWCSTRDTDNLDERDPTYIRKETSRESNKRNIKVTILRSYFSSPKKRNSTFWPKSSSKHWQIFLSPDKKKQIETGHLTDKIVQGRFIYMLFVWHENHKTTQLPTQTTTSSFTLPRGGNIREINAN